MGITHELGYLRPWCWCVQLGVAVFVMRDRWTGDRMSELVELRTFPQGSLDVSMWLLILWSKCTFHFFELYEFV